jgi:hypothetical protein
MSDQFIFVVSCIGDIVAVGQISIHKEDIVIIAVLIDFIGVLILFHFFDKLEKFNQEFLKVYIDNNLTMKDFALQCSDIKFDKST